MPGLINKYTGNFYYWQTISNFLYIIVLLILAGIALNLTIGENGLFTRAQNAANTWQMAEQNEQNAMNSLSSWMDQYLNGNGESQEDDQGSIKVSFTIEGEKVTEPPIPSGFTHVDGTVDTGYVIEDGDENQFVWVPVDKNQKIKINVTSEANIDSISLTDPYGDEIPLANTDDLGKTYNNEEVNPTINGPYVLTVTAGEETKKKGLCVHSLYAIDTMADGMLSEEYAESLGTTLKQLISSLGLSTLEEAYEAIGPEMKEKYSYYKDTEIYTESVNNNGGFYIARYEASYQNGKVASRVSTSTRYDDSTPLTNGMLWNYIEYNDALLEAKAMYKSEDFESSLPTGAVWDRILGWLEETGVVTSFEIAVDSKSWGNYSDDTFTTGEELINTGYTDKDGKSLTEKNHIYDIAGNLREWTTEAEAITYPTTRGGDFYQPSADLPASSRFGYPSNETRDHIGFRVALYL